MSEIRTFVSFHAEHDRELYDELLAQSKAGSSGFCVVGCSERTKNHGQCSEKTAERIRSADQLIVLCGENSEDSPTMTAELRVAQEEDMPYILVWGRRDVMCTKPVGTKNSDGMYSWTASNLRDQMELNERSVKWKTPNPEFARPARSKRSNDDAEDAKGAKGAKGA